MALDTRSSDRAARLPRCLPALARTNPAAVAWAREQAARLITGVSDELRGTIRQLVIQAFERGVPPRELARQIHEITEFGLTPRAAAAVARLRARLHAAQPGQLVRVGGWRVRVPRTGVTPDFVATRTTAYLRRWRRWRALTIARTETMAASNAGQDLLWRQATQQRLLTGREQRVWITTPDDRLCPRCAAMDGQRVPLEAHFVENGRPAVERPPLHPMCRCAVGLVTAPVRERRGG